MSDNFDDYWPQEAVEIMARELMDHESTDEDFKHAQKFVRRQLSRVFLEGSDDTRFEMARLFSFGHPEQGGEI